MSDIYAQVSDKRIIISNLCRRSLSDQVVYGLLKAVSALFIRLAYMFIVLFQFGMAVASWFSAMSYETRNHSKRNTGSHRHSCGKRNRPGTDKRKGRPILSTTQLHKLPVYNHDGQPLGRLKDLMIETDRGTVAYAVLLFEDDKSFALPFNMLNIDLEALKIYVDIEPEVFRQGRGLTDLQD